MPEMFRTTGAVSVGAGLAAGTASAGGVLVMSTVVLSETFVIAVSQRALSPRALHVIQPDRTLTSAATIDGDTRAGRTNQPI